MARRSSSRVVEEFFDIGDSDGEAESSDGGPLTPDEAESPDAEPMIDSSRHVSVPPAESRERTPTPRQRYPNSRSHSVVDLITPRTSPLTRPHATRTPTPDTPRPATRTPTPDAPRPPGHTSRVRRVRERPHFPYVSVSGTAGSSSFAHPPIPEREGPESVASARRRRRDAIAKAAASAASARIALGERRGAPSRSEVLKRADMEAAMASARLMLEEERIEQEREERAAMEESEAEGVDDGTDDIDEVEHAPLPEHADTSSVQDFFTYCKNWLDHEHRNKTRRVKILPTKMKFSVICLDATDSGPIRDQKLSYMIRIGVLFVKHCGLRIPKASDDKTNITGPLRADLVKYTTSTLEALFEAHKKPSSYLTLAQVAWMLYQFPNSPAGVNEAILRDEVTLLSRYRHDITYQQCERLKFDLLEYGPRGGVVTSDVMADGCVPFQENVLAILHRSADAHNRKELDEARFTVADAVWLSLHTNDKDNEKNAEFERIMKAVIVHCNYQFSMVKGESNRKQHQQKIEGCKTPGQLLRGNASLLEMSPQIYPYARRPLFTRYPSVNPGNMAKSVIKEISSQIELTKPIPRPYEAVLELFYEANCNLNKKGDFDETGGSIDVLFPTRRPWKLPIPRGLALRRQHALHLMKKFPDEWYKHRDKVSLRIWMQIPLCVSSVYYFKHVHTMFHRTLSSAGSSPGPMHVEPDFRFPGLPTDLDANNGGFANPGAACYMNAAFQALLRSKIGPRFMRSVQRMARVHLNNLRDYWNTQNTEVKKKMKEATRRLFECGLKFRNEAVLKLCTYDMLILYVIDAYSKNVRGGVEPGIVQHMISNDEEHVSSHERTAFEKKCTAMIGPNYIRQVLDDDNCFFSCVAVSENPDYSAEQVKVRQAQLRQELVAYLRRGMEAGNLPGLLSPFVNEDWLNEMANDRALGDETAFMGMSQMLGRCINVYRPMNNGHLTLFQEHRPDEIKVENDMHIFNTGIHFDVLVPPILINARMNMDPENPQQVAKYTLMNNEEIKRKIMEHDIRSVWNHFIFFAAMYELTERYCEAQTQKTVSLIDVYDSLLVHRVKIPADRGRHLFDYRLANDAGEAISELCDRSAKFAVSINDTHETLKTLISHEDIRNGVCTTCSTQEATKIILNPIAVILVDMPHVKDNILRTLQDFTTETEGQTEGTYECPVCEGAGTAAIEEGFTEHGRPVKKYGGTRTFIRRHADFTCFQLQWISLFQEKNIDQPIHNPNLVNLTIPETIKLVGVDSAEHDYNLIAVVHHTGGFHYKTCVKTGGVWMDYNDVDAVACTLEDAVRCTGAQSDPYLLFYEKLTQPRAETSATPQFHTPLTSPRVETPQAAAINVVLPWNLPPDQYMALVSAVPSLPVGGTNVEEMEVMRPWLGLNTNIGVALVTTRDETLRAAYNALLRRLTAEVHNSNAVFGTKQIERLTKHRESTGTSAVVLSQNEILALMTCALFDFFPHSREKEYEHIGLTRIFRTDSTSTENWGVEKTRCILNYLHMADSDRGGTRQVYFKRHIARFSEAHWMASLRPMKRCIWHDMDPLGNGVVKIEDVCDLLQGQAWEVDFANASIGGGVTGAGCVQEEIRFMQCPELLVSILITDLLENDESVQITGYRQFNNTRGYGRESRANQPRFEYVGPHEAEEPVHGRSMLVMDAKYYAVADWTDQFRWNDIKRELDKARCAFDYSENANWPIVTGHWGCGAFHGNHRLKLYIQLLAAAEAGKSVHFCNFGDPREAQTRAFMQSIPENAPVGKLYKRLKQVVMEHNEDLNWYQDPDNLTRFFNRLTRRRYTSLVRPMENVNF